MTVNTGLRVHTSFSEVEKVMHLFSGFIDEMFVNSVKTNEIYGVIRVSL